MKNKYMKNMSVVFALLFVSIVSAASVSGQNMFRKINDFDGDLKADYVITRNENGLKVWYVWQSTAGFHAFQWGLDSDKEAAGDYDGDGKTDFAVHRITPRLNEGPDTTFYVYRSMTNTVYITGNSYFQPVTFIKSNQQDYDGDGKTDVTEFLKWNNTQDFTIRVTESHNNSSKWYSVPITDSGERLGDLTGDGKADVVSYNPTTQNLSIYNVSLYPNVTKTTVHFGISGDQFVPADFDGDGKGDITVFRESDGTWWWIRSSDGGILVAKWGISGDTPVPADYDGDGITDLAIWRSGFYWILGSQNGISVVNWGLSTDTVVTY